MARKPAPGAEDQLLRAAQQCLLERGFDTKVSEITERAGVAKGTFYLYFKDKEQCCHRAIDAFLVSLSEGLMMPRQREHFGLEEQFNALLIHSEKVLTFCSRNRAMLRLLFGATGDRAYAGVEHSAAERTSLLFEKLARDLMAEGIYEQRDHSELAVRFIGGGYERLVKLLVESPKVPDLAASSRTALEIVTIGC